MKPALGTLSCSSFARKLAAFILCPACIVAQTSTCTGPVAPTEKDSAGKTPYVVQGQTFHVNINIPGLKSNQLIDIQNGINSWANVSGITIVFDSSAPGVGVITVGSNSSLQEPGLGTFSDGQGSAPANQITSGTINFNFGYQYPYGGTSTLQYQPNAPNADKYLQGLAAHEMGHVLGLDNTSDSSDPCTQTSNSVMGGGCGPNNTGDPSVPGSTGAPTSITPTQCDKQTVNAQTSTNTAPAPTSSSGGGGGGNPGGSGGDEVGGCGSYSYNEWDDSSNTLTNYSGSDCPNEN